MAGSGSQVSPGLPGVPYGPAGRESSIEIIQPGEEVNADEDVCLIKNSEIPTSILVVHIHSLHDMQVREFDGAEDICLYVTFSVASTKKVTSKKLFTSKSNSILVFNEVKYIPLIINLKADEHMNKFIILVFACRAGEEHAVTKSKHKLIGRFETSVHDLLKEVVMKEHVDLLSKYGNTVGKCEMELAILYGSFGYAQSHQLKSSSHTPDEMAKLSLFPRIYPTCDTSFRGTDIFPRKLCHPSIVPLENEPVENLEPDTSSTKNEKPLKCPTFPMLEQHMQRITQLRSGYRQQTTRAKRIYYLKNILQVDSGLLSADIEEANDDDEPEQPSYFSPALTLLMNATKFFYDAPGIVRRREPSVIEHEINQGSTSSRDV